MTCSGFYFCLPVCISLSINVSRLSRKVWYELLSGEILRHIYRSELKCCPLETRSFLCVSGGLGGGVGVGVDFLFFPCVAL